jgi:hypothetical protein
MPNKTIKVQSSLDIISARMAVRQLARSVGLRTMDQARIALATSSLAYALGLDNGHKGQITIESCMGHDCKGVRVVCTANVGEREETPLFGDARWMVDDYEMARPLPGQLKATIIKWVS